MGRVMQKRVIEHMWTEKAQISLCVWQSTQSDQDHRCPLTESLYTIKCGEKISRNEDIKKKGVFAHVQNAQNQIHLERAPDESDSVHFAHS